MIFDVYAIGVCLYYYAFRNQESLLSGKKVTAEKAHVSSNEPQTCAFFFQMWVVCAGVVVCSTGKHVG